jgi:hypothetical protein
VHNRLNDLYPLFNFLNIYTDYPTWHWAVLNEIKKNPINGFAVLQTLVQVNTEMKIPSSLHASSLCAFSLRSSSRPKKFTPIFNRKLDCEGPRQ